MLRIDNQGARSRETKPGLDRGFSQRQRRELHPCRTRGTHPAVLQRALESQSELPSPLRPSRYRGRRERPSTAPLPTLSNPAASRAVERAVEMTVHAKPCGFRTHLGNRFAIPTFQPPRRLLDSFNTKSRKELSSAIPSGFLQAHSSIGKDLPGIQDLPSNRLHQQCCPDQHQTEVNILEKGVATQPMVDEPAEQYRRQHQSQ